MFLNHPQFYVNTEYLNDSFDQIFSCILQESKLLRCFRLQNDKELLYPNGSGFNNQAHFQSPFDRYHIVNLNSFHLHIVYFQWFLQYIRNVGVTHAFVSTTKFSKSLVYYWKLWWGVLIVFIKLFHALNEPLSLQKNTGTYKVHFRQSSLSSLLWLAVTQKLNEAACSKLNTS